MTSITPPLVCRAFLFVLGLSVAASPADAREAGLTAYGDVTGVPVSPVEVRHAGKTQTYASLADESLQHLAQGLYRLTWQLSSGEAVRVPVCAGRVAVSIGERVEAVRPGPLVFRIADGKGGAGGSEQKLSMDVDVGAYEHRIACDSPPVVGQATPDTSLVLGLTFESPDAKLGGGHAVVVVPRERQERAPLLVGLPPWNGSPWTYVAYDALLREARDKGVILLFPSSLGNSLYTQHAENEVLAAIRALASRISFDPERVSVFGASMGGAGATTIGFHHPDLFASITSFFGDSKYDLHSYVRGILRSETEGHRVNALDVVENVENVPVWLIHGDADRVSNIEQSELLFREMKRRGLSVQFDRVPDKGHEGELVTRHARELIDRAVSRVRPRTVRRVVYRSVKPEDDGAYGVHFVRRGSSRDARVEVEKREDSVHIVAAENVTAVTLDPKWFGATQETLPAIVVEPGIDIAASWVIGHE